MFFERNDCLRDGKIEKGVNNMSYGKFLTTSGITTTIKAGLNVVKYQDSDGTVYTDIHIYKTSGSEKVGLGIFNGTAVALSNAKLCPDGVAESKLKVKTNCAFFDPSGPKTYDGIFYDGSDGTKIFFNQGVPISPDSAATVTGFLENQWHYPCYCVRHSNWSDVKWFGGLSKFKQNYQNYDFIISAAQVIVSQECSVYDQNVLSDVSIRIATSSPGDVNLSNIHNANYGAPGTKRERTLFGELTTSGKFILACAKGGMNCKVAAHMMCDLGCKTAVSVDGGSSTSMVVRKNGSWVTEVAPLNGNKCTALCVY